MNSELSINEQLHNTNREDNAESPEIQQNESIVTNHPQPVISSNTDVSPLKAIKAGKHTDEVNKEAVKLT